MQTFLPYPDFDNSAHVLDRLRLGKQRVEVYQILNCLNSEPDNGNGWRNHPAVLMWDGYTEALIEYGIAVCEAWIDRGYKDSLLPKIADMSWGGEVVKPPWFGDLKFHRSHQSNLIRKHPVWYRPFWPDVPNDLPYVWPVRRPSYEQH